jgi:hypothetical protein
MDVSVLQHNREGYIYDPVINQNAGAVRLWAVRSKLLFRPDGHLE